MKKMAKIAIVAFALLMVASVAFVGCGKPKAKLDVGVVLPTKDEPRWVQDEARFLEALKGQANVELLFSQGDSGKEKQNVEALLTKGIKVLIICPQDGTAAAAAADAAKKEGVTVISYDRLITNTNSVDYYVTFDSVSVGKAQAQYLVKNLPAGTKGAPLYLYAGAASDNNAFLFFQGGWEILQPLIANGTFVIKNSAEAIALQGKKDLSRAEMAKIVGQVTTDWNFDVAKKKAADNLTNAKAADKGVCYILAPNDGTARAIADEFSKDKDVSKFYVTGQDAEKASVQYIIDGKQSMTVFKDVRTLVQDAVKMATDVLAGKTPVTTGAYDNGKKQVAAKQTEVITVEKSNVKSSLVDSGYYPASDFSGL